MPRRVRLMTASASPCVWKSDALLASKRDRQSGLMVLITDGEELGLLGAAALVNDPEVRNRVRAYIDLDNAGSDVPAVLFETGPGNRALMTAWNVAPEPRGGSVAEEVYKRLPNDTDFTIFKRAGIPGLNIGAIGDSYAYHTPRDTPDRLTDAVIRQMGQKRAGRPPKRSTTSRRIRRTASN